VRKCGREERRNGEGGEGEDAILRMVLTILRNILRIS